MVLPPAPFALARVDLTSVAGVSREGLALRLAAAEARRPFDLTAGRMLRASVLQLGAEDHLLLVSMHHVASDGWSVGLLVREMVALYGAQIEGSPPRLPELPIQYADFALWQRQWLRGEVLERELGYWRGQLAGAPAVLALPLDRPRPAVLSDRGGAVELAIPERLVQELRAVGRRQGVTLFMTLLAGFTALLARLTGEPDVSVGTVVAGRNHASIEPLIGFFVNTLVLRLRALPDEPFALLLAEAREIALAAHLHQDLPFERLVEELATQRSLSHSPLFQAMLSLQNASWETLEVSGLELTQLDASNTTAKFELTLALNEERGGLSGSIEYSADLFDATTIDRLGERLLRLLDGALAAPERRLSELPLIGAAERQQVLGVERRRAVAAAGALSAPALRAAGGDGAGEPGARLAGRRDELRRAGAGVQPAGARAAPHGGGRGVAGRPLPGAEPGDGGGAPGHSEGGRGLRAARSGLSAGAAGVDAGGRRACRPW